jgi:hypothetical protein
MEGVVIKKGGRLAFTRWIYDESVEAGEYKSEDITARPYAFLFEPCRLEKDVTLADVLAIVRGHEILQTIFQRDWASELVEEAFTGDWKPAPTGYAPDAIEYLEIYQVWAFDSRSRTYQPNTPPDFHGVGVELRDDHYENGSLTGKKGARIHWGLSFTSPRELMNLPVRINPEIKITEDDTESERYGHTLDTVRYELLPLCQILHAVIWELMWNGPAEDRDQCGNEIMERAREAREHPERLVELNSDEMKKRILDQQ